MKMVKVNWLYSGLSDSCAHPNALLHPHPKKEVTGEKLQRLVLVYNILIWLNWIGINPFHDLYMIMTSFLDSDNLPFKTS